MSNGWANTLNRRIRSLLYPDAGALPLMDEWLMVVRNHYLKAQEFVANGEMVQVKHMVEQEDQVAGFRWADMRGVYQDLSGEDRNLSATLLLDLLNSKSAGLDTVSWQRLWAARQGERGITCAIRISMRFMPNTHMPLQVTRPRGRVANSFCVDGGSLWHPRRTFEVALYGGHPRARKPLPGSPLEVFSYLCGFLVINAKFFRHKAKFVRHKASIVTKFCSS